LRIADRRILVTGADGFIGSHLTERLVAEGAEVTALALYNSFDSHGWLDALPAEVRGALTLIRGDVRDGPFLLGAVEGQDLVFHLAALIAIPHSYVAAHSFVDVNVAGTLNVLEAVRRHGVGRLVHTSTSEVYGTARTMPIDETHPLQAQSPYAASKIAADSLVESYARSFGLPVAILRPFNTFGPRQSERAVIPTIIRQALDPQCPAIRIGDTTPVRDFSYVGDTVDAFLAVGTAETIEFGTVYNSGSGRPTSVAEVIELVLRETGSEKPVETDAERIRPERSEVRLLLADAGRLAAATGWRPQVSLEEGLARTIRWWRERFAADAVRPDARYST
jgi:UDP-glucose 4-epimerase